MSKKIEVKVNMNCETCKIEVLKAVTKELGIDQVSADLEKQVLIVIGDVDPVCIVNRVRKIGKVAEIISVGPPKKPDDPKKLPDPPCPKLCPYPCCQIICPPPPCYAACPSHVIVEYPQQCDNGGCFIL